MQYVEEAVHLRNSQKGRFVRRFEEAFAKYVGAQYAIAHANGTCTMHTALAALGVGPGDTVAVPPLTYGSTTLAVLHAGAAPYYHDVDDETWTMRDRDPHTAKAAIPVSLYGLWSACEGSAVVEDAAETLNQHRGAAFTSYSFEASKILAIGEGGMLVTDHEGLAAEARSFSIVGTTFERQERSPEQIRHVRVGWNYQMSDVQAAVGLARLEEADALIAGRLYAAQCYAQAIAGCEWIRPQHVPTRWEYTPWCYGIALERADLWEPFALAIVGAGGEMPYAAFRLTYDEPGLDHLKPGPLWRCTTCQRVMESYKMPAMLSCTHWGGDCPGTAIPSGGCPIAEDLQPRLMQLQTNHDKAGAERAAEILRQALASVEVRVA